MITPVELIMACLLDLAIGDPRWLPHPVRIIGYSITKTEAFLRRWVKTASGEERAGVLLTAFIVTGTFGVTVFVHKALDGLSGTIMALIGKALIVYLIATTIAVRELVCSAQTVIDAVKTGNLETARLNLSMIVGRDTENLSEDDILKATMETLAENLSDGIIAPLLYLAVGGLPLAMAYKAVNTLDSMIGYRNSRYTHFGKAAARLDDIANYIPARIAGLLVIVSSAAVFRSILNVRQSFKTMLRDGRNHLSPNSGIPEAAVAGALGVRFGGPSAYGGLIVDKPYIGDRLEEDYMSASIHTITMIKTASMLGIAMAAAILFVRNLL